MLSLPNSHPSRHTISDDSPQANPSRFDLDVEAPDAVSFFEFWPTWIIYIPVVFVWLFNAIRYRSLSLPLIANPELPLGGMVGVPKSQLQDMAQGVLKQQLLPYQLVLRSDKPAADQVARTLPQLQRKLGPLPLVCKPDIGCRGAGVKLVATTDALTEVFTYYPEGAGILMQRLASSEQEAGVFYLRHPSQEHGKIISMAFKYTPYVMGDGEHTLAELVSAMPRAGSLSHLYQARHQDRWNTVPAKDEIIKLVFSASHCRGAVFRDARAYITPALTAKIDELMKCLPEFYYGRLDLKFASLDALKAGETLEIIEINTVSSEPLHIWDGRASFRTAMKALCYQYNELFKIGAENRKRGYKTPGILALFEGLKRERKLVARYPSND